MIKQRYEALSARIDALSLRERGMIFATLAALLYLFWSTLLLAPLEQEQQALLEQIETLRGEVTALDSQTLAVMQRHNTDPNRKEREQLADIEHQLAQTERQISETISGLIEPEQMADILEQVLQRQRGLTFVRLENLGREALVDVDTEDADVDTAGIFKHSLRLELEGSYTELLAYLRELERLEVQFRWDEVSITMLDYPRAAITITVHTLSMQEGWLSV
ncbi:MAG: hypothetical protein ACQETD_03925 [Pseudomonadota bacterium]